MAENICPHCGAQLDGSPPYCSNCGTSLVPAAASVGRTCLAVVLLLIALPLSAVGGCFAVFAVAGGGGGKASYYLMVAGIILVAVLLFAAAIKILRNR